MQVGPTIDIVLIGLPAIFVGLLVGYVIGGMPSFRLIDRIGLGIVISGAGGLILSIAIGFFYTIGPLEMMFVVLAFAGGYCLGLSLNWKPPLNTGPKNHIIYEPDDDDAFDKEIEEALGGKA